MLSMYNRADLIYRLESGHYASCWHTCEIHGESGNSAGHLEASLWSKIQEAGSYGMSLIQNTATNNLKQSISANGKKNCIYHLSDWYSAYSLKNVCIPTSDTLWYNPSVQMLMNRWQEMTMINDGNQSELFSVRILRGATASYKTINLIKTSSCWLNITLKMCIYQHLMSI